MSSGDIIFEDDERMRGISQVVEQNLNPRIRERFPDEPHQPHIVLEILIRIVDNFSAVIFFEELHVNSLLCRLELAADVTLFANKNQLPRRRVVLVLKEVMHSQPEIFQTEFAEILATDCERIKIVFLQISPKFAAAFLVFSPNESSGEKQQGDND